MSAIRIEVLEGGEIEIMRIIDGKSSFMTYQKLEQALHVLQYLVRRDHKKSKDELFVSRIDKEAQEEYQKLLSRSPYYEQKT